MNKLPANLMPALYSHRIHDIQVICRAAGYAIAIHGSMQRDLDLVAIPWTKRAVKHTTLARRLCAELGCTLSEVKKLTGATKKPHGRLVYTLMMGGACFMDLSIMPRLALENSK